MYGFFGIVDKKDLRKGNFKPKYVLCRGKNPGTYQLTYEGTVDKGSVILVTTPYGNEDLINYMSHATVTINAGLGRRKQRIAAGTLFLFECDVYGRLLGRALYIKDVPEQKNKVAEPQERLLNLMLSAEPLTMPTNNNRALVLPQHSRNKGNEGRK